jgi:hypothetical protein
MHRDSNNGNHRHVVMQNGLLVAIVPFERHARPVRLGDCALIAFVFAPTDAVANF